MLEKEIKVLDINLSDIEQKIKKLRGFKTFDGVIHDDYYDVPGGFLDQNGYSLRIRTFNGTDPHITFKIKQKHKILKVAQEYEFATHGQAAHTFLLFKKRGLKPVRSKTKHRVSYSLQDTVIDIDQYEHLPTLLEIEGNTTKQIMQWVEKLGLQDHKTLKCGYRGLCKFYQSNIAA